MNTASAPQAGENVAPLTSISERIKDRRKARGLSQEALALLLGLSQGAVSQWEMGGMPSTEILPALAEVLEVSIDWLFGLDPTNPAEIQRQRVKVSGMRLVARVSALLEAGELNQDQINLLSDLLEQIVRRR